MNRFEASADDLDAGVKKLRFQTEQGRILTRREIFALWRTAAPFSAFFSESLAAAPFEAFFWETPPLTSGAFDLPFECVLISAAALARQKADPTPFAKHIDASRATCDVVAFSNLGGDAELIVPCDSETGVDYAHLAAFLRTAPLAQIQALWRTLADRAEGWFARGERFWISTAGLGAAWVHVRIDSRPKYYRHAAYALGAPK